MVWPFGPVVCRLPVQTPPAHDAVPCRVTLLPYGPVRVMLRLQVPPAQLPDPCTLDVPRGPVTDPVRVQALASAAAPMIKTVARAERAMSLFISISFAWLATALLPPITQAKMTRPGQPSIDSAYRCLSLGQRRVTGCNNAASPLVTARIVDGQSAE
jgi:hypothetical protein